MKLVDILARELKVWPHAGNALGQAHDGTLHLNERAAHDVEFYGWTKEKFTRAEGWNTAWVTRAEWQSAVEALKAEQAAELKWPDGVPPAGTVCEIAPDCESCLWNKGEILAVGPTWFAASFAGECAVLKVEGYKFRPIRTQEQIAAEEREKAIEEMILLDEKGSLSRTHFCGLLYDVSYRKQPK